MNQRVEKTKVSVRQLREEKREEIKREEKNKEIGEDEKYRLDKEIQKLIDECNEKIEDMAEKKEKQIMTI